MSMYSDLEKMTASIKKFIESDAGKKYFNNIKIAQENKNRRFNQFGEWLKSNDIDSYFYRVLNKHNKEYREKSYLNGIEPSPNNVLQFIIDYAFTFGIPVDEKKKKKLKIDSTFANSVAYFMGSFSQEIKSIPRAIVQRIKISFFIIGFTLYTLRPKYYKNQF